MLTVLYYPEEELEFKIYPTQWQTEDYGGFCFLIVSKYCIFVDYKLTTNM